MNTEIRKSKESGEVRSCNEWFPEEDRMASSQKLGIVNISISERSYIKAMLTGMVNKKETDYREDMESKLIRPRKKMDRRLRRVWRKRRKTFNQLKIMAKERKAWKKCVEE